MCISKPVKCICHPVPLLQEGLPIVPAVEPPEDNLEDNPEDNPEDDLLPQPPQERRDSSTLVWISII